MSDKCFVCGKRLGKNPTIADTRDGQTVYVGRECARKITEDGLALGPIWGIETDLKLYPIIVK